MKSEAQPRISNIIKDMPKACDYWRGLFKRLDDGELCRQMDVLREETARGVAAKKRLPRVFALAAEACRRVMGLVPYPVQYMAAAALADCEIAQMNTGEGKTLTSILPACFRALDGKGVHVITVNEYLARRDFEANSPVYALLGFSTGLSLSGMDVKEKQSAYACDITYSTATEAGFDWLRDGMATKREHRVQRGLYCAIVDEADSILLDEAVTPMILSGGGKGDDRDYRIADTLVKYLKKTVYDSLDDDERAIDEYPGDYVVDRRRRLTFLTSEGIRKAERYYRTENLFDIKNLKNYHFLLQALDAYGILERDVDYIVVEGKVLIVDRNTGRVMQGRRYSAGLHQAVEAREGLEIHQESRVLSSVTYQNYFMSYTYLSGMTGTAWQARRELSDTYGVRVRKIPPNRPCIRIDRPDRFFPNGEASLEALVQTVKAAHSNGRPVLVGTVDDRTSDEVSARLSDAGVPHRVLNARQNAEEADMIASAGMPGSVIVATNMAGRGTDIRLGGGDPDLAEKVKKLGGLLVVGARRQRSSRVDRQLAGRAGRQGDPGESVFFVSPDDDLIRLFGDGDASRRGVVKAQRRAEAEDANQRSSALETDTILQIHRQNLLKQRDRLLDSGASGKILREMINLLIDRMINDYPDPADGFSRFRVAYFRVFGIRSPSGSDSGRDNLNPSRDEDYPDAAAYEKSAVNALCALERKAPGAFDEISRAVLLQLVDEAWCDFLEGYEELKEGYRLMSSGKGKPYITLIQHSALMLDAANAYILEEGLRRVFRLKVEKDSQLLFD
ncbi:MAG: preprotein translocase subunit SecA [Clostridia bacterium]|nr:preprotein translocase subunit SecA [Clostridia bacterium]